MTDMATPPASATQISDKLFISAQPKLEDFPGLAAAGSRASSAIDRRESRRTSWIRRPRGRRQGRVACPSTSFRSRQPRSRRPMFGLFRR